MKGLSRPGKLCGLKEDDMIALSGKGSGAVASAGAAAYDENLGVLEGRMSDGV